MTPPTPRQPTPDAITPTPIDNWRKHAACQGQTQHMFPKGHKDISYLAQARTICRTCPVRNPCLEYALQFPPADMHGVWAGLTSRQLLEEQRRRGVRASRPTIASLWTAD